MKVKKDTLVGFFKQAAMTGVSALTECIVDFNKKGIKISSQSASNNVLINAVLKAKAIDDYKELGQVGLHNLQDLVKLLDGFVGESVKIVKKDNQLVFSASHRRVKVTLMDKDALVKPTEYPKNLEERNEITIDMDILKGFFKNMSIVNTSEFSFSIKDKDLYFHTKGFNEVTEKVSIKDKGFKKAKVDLKLSRAFVDAVENLTGTVTLALKSDYPITVKANTDDTDIKILVAPIVKE